MSQEEKRNLTEKLLYLQQNLKAPKGQYNSFGDYHYRSCEDIQEALKPLLAHVKAVLLLNDEILQIGERFYIKATAKLQDVESNECITNTAYARECESRPKMDVAQLTGSCSSYARKYALNGLFCIDDAKDPDAMKPDSKQPEPKPPQQKPPQRQQSRQQTKPKLEEEYQKNVRKEAERTGTDLRKVCERYKVKDISELSYEDYLRSMVAFKKMESLPPPVENEQMSMFMDINSYDGEVPFR